MTYGYIPISQPWRNQRYRLAQGHRDILERRMRRAQDQVQKRSHPGRQRGAEHRLDVPVDLRLVEFRQHFLRETLDAEAEHAEARPPHGGQALIGHRIDAVGADELQVLGDAPARFAAMMPSHSGRIRRSRVKVKISSWKMMVRARG